MKQLKPLLRTPTWHRGFVTVSSQASRARQAGLKAAAALPVHGLQRAVERESWLITSHHITSHHIISYHIISDQIIPYQYQITSYHILLCCLKRYVMLSYGSPGPREKCNASICGKKHSSGEEDPWECRLTKSQIMGWDAVFPAGLHCQGLHKRNVFSQTPVVGFLVHVWILMYMYQKWANNSNCLIWLRSPFSKRKKRPPTIIIV